MRLKRPGNVQQIQKNMYAVLCGFWSYSDKQPFDASLFVEFRKRLGVEQINAINEKILNFSISRQKVVSANNKKEDEPGANTPTTVVEKQEVTLIGEDLILLK